jgi:hypothetical protein
MNVKIGTEAAKLLFWGYINGIFVAVRYQIVFFCLGCSSQPSTKYFSPHRTLFHFLCPHRPASKAGSRAGSPVSWRVSLVIPASFPNRGGSQ